MKITIQGHKFDYPYIFVNGVQMPATFIARPANPRVDMGRRIIIEPALPEGGNVLLTADYLDFEINETVISDNPSAYTPANVLQLLNEGFESPTGDDFPGIGSGLYSGGGGSPEIPDGSITTAKLADGAVTTAKIADGAIIDKKIANYAVGTNAIQNNAINSSKIVDRAVGRSKIGLKVIDRTNIADGGISTVNIADKAITAEKIADATITAGQIAAETITNEEIANKTIIANQKLEDDSIKEAQYGAASVSTRALQVGAVNNSALANTAVTTDKIKDDSVTPEKLAPSIRTSIPIQTQILDHNTSVRQTISEGNISILKIPASASNQAVNIQLSEEDTDILVHHWPIFIYKDTEDAFAISISGVAGRLEISLPTYSINCVLNVYSHTGYGFVVDVGQPNFISK